MTDTWKIILPCTREEADYLSENEPFISSDDNPPTIVTSEADPETPDNWLIEIYCNAKPDAGLLESIAELSPSARIAGVAPSYEKLPDEDWVTLSQQGLEPIRTGRFYVHTPSSPPLYDSDVINICIDAGRAFGTGHHQTTMGCLQSLDRLKRLGGRYRNIIDVGTGTGLLAFAARHLWPAAKIIASDIDPVAVQVSKDNARINAFPSAPMPGAIELLTSNGLDHKNIARRAPYDLIIANILAGPLIALAPQIAAAAAPRTTLILAGLLKEQHKDVLHAYIRAGFRLRHEIMENEWPCLTLVKTNQYGATKIGRIIKSPLARDYFGEC
ncbi:50S ribosomal protein L11 methyltransferase [Parasphingorhabdus sp. JC815]|uniref:50S ribosomal protein L11 methyltransferase n=1 Tax=Parasphingorhabdus sp. JC815 TaxID=3232140 RepID=UPI003459920E